MFYRQHFDDKKFIDKHISDRHIRRLNHRPLPMDVAVGNHLVSV